MTTSHKHQNITYKNTPPVGAAGLHIRTGIKSGAEGCEAILCRMDGLIEDMQSLRGEMGQMAEQMAGMSS